MTPTIDLTTATNTNFKPTLHDVHCVLDEEVVGEHEARLSLFTNWILGEKDCLMAGQRSSGKTFITDHIVSFVGERGKDEKGQVFKLTSGSEKSTWYEAEELEKAKYVVVLELNKITNTAKETLKDWGEGKDSIYKSTVMAGGRRQVQKMVLKRRPFVFCLADEEEVKLDTQLSSRLTIIRTDNSITQNKKVMKHQAMLAKLPNNPLMVDFEKKKKLSEHIKTLPPLENYDWKHPAADSFTECIPPFFTDSRRDYPKYLSNTNGICRFYWKERIKCLVNDKETYFITPQDMYLNHIIYGTTLVSSALKCNNIEREVMKLLQSSSSALQRADIQMEMKKRGTTLSAGMLSKHLRGLVDLGYLEVNPTAERKNMYEYKIGTMFQDFEFEINWSQIIEDCIKTVTELYPDISEEYIKTYCDNPTVTNPFTGETVNLKEIKVEKVTSHLGQSSIVEPKEEKNMGVKEETIDEDTVKTFEDIDAMFSIEEEVIE